jgi:regulator of sigma E protease
MALDMLVTFLGSVVAFVFVLGVLVVLHEAGHFLAARLLGATVDVFSIGFGKRLWGFERGGTDYRVSLVPLGGYVRIIGLGPDESTVAGAQTGEVELLARWRRALILVAGPVANIVGAVGFLTLAFLIGAEVPAYQEQPPVVGWVEPDSPAAAAGVLAGDRITQVDGVKMSVWRDLDSSLLTSGGHEVVLTVDRAGQTLAIRMTPKKVTRYDFGYSGIAPPIEPTVTSLQRGFPAEAAGLKVGDRIVGVDGQPVSHFYDLVRLISPHPGQPVALKILRQGQEISITLTPRDEGGEGKIGVAPVQPTTVVRLGPAAALQAGARECRRLTVETFRVLRKLLSFRASLRQISGPIDIAHISGEAARGGPPKLIWLMGLISLQLGIFNLLPIPLLDGGHLTIVALESAIRRDLSVRLKERILEYGFYLLIALMVVVVFNDIVKRLPDNLYYRLFSKG